MTSRIKCHDLINSLHTRELFVVKKRKNIIKNIYHFCSHYLHINSKGTIGAIHHLSVGPYSIAILQCTNSAKSFR